MNEHSPYMVDNPYYPYILYYVPTLNRFMDHQRCIVHNLSQLFNTWQLDDWKNKAKTDIMTTKDGTQMMVYFLTDEEEDLMLDYLGNEESYGVKIDRINY